MARAKPRTQAPSLTPEFSLAAPKGHHRDASTPGNPRQGLNAALVAVGIGTYQWDVITDRLYADENLAQMFGITLDVDGAAPIGRFLDIIHPDDRERVAARVRHSVASAEDFSEDYRVGHRDNVRWVNGRGRMVQDASGRVVNFFGLVMDITERKRAEQEREQIADRLRRLTAIHETVLSGINDFAYVFDPQGRFLYANRALLELYGRPLEDVVGKTFSELGYPAWTAELHLREIAQVIATRRPIQGEIPFKSETGRSGIYDYIFSPVFGEDGHVEAVAGTTRDVTDRRRGEVRDRLLVDLDDATRPLTDPGEIMQASARLLGEHLGVNRCAYADVEEDENTFNLTGDFNRDVPSIVGRYRFDQFGAECLRLMRAGEPFVVTDSETDPRTTDVRDAYRATLIRSVICVPLMKAGRFVAAMAVHQKTPRAWQQADVDATLLIAGRCWESIERARVVRVLADSEQRLRLAVGEQTRLRDEAVRASRAKDDFLAALSHELRTPLNPVLLIASDAVQDPALSPAVRESFETIRRNVELEARLIDDLLDLTSIVRGKLAIKKAIRDLHTLLNDALAAVRPEFVEKGISLEVRLNAQRPRVFVDELRIAQVFINLLRNAAKFTPAGGRVTVETTQEDDVFVVRLTDTGIGMTPQEIHRAFDAFTQGDHATSHGSHRFGGLGLGLAISSRLVALHGGSITATSAGRGQGTSFAVRLPAHAGQSGENSPAMPAEPSATPKGDGERILLVEDHDATRRALETLLRKRNCNVVSAGSLAEARTHAAAGTFDVVVSDLGLPDGSGIELMSELRDRFGLVGIALTGFGMEEDIERCRRAGFVTHLTKPVRIEALEAALRSLRGNAS